MAERKAQHEASTEEFNLDVDLPLEAEETENSFGLRTTSVVANGLKLRKNSGRLDSTTFDYKPAIVYDADLAPRNWHLLSASDIVGDHIKIHELSEGDNLLECARQYQECHAKAMIVINTTEDFTLSPELSQPIVELNSFVVAILTRADGMRLLKCLKIDHEDDEVYARLDVGSETTPDKDATSAYEETEGMDMNSWSVVPHTGSTSEDFSCEVSSNNSYSTDWKVEIKKLMVDGDRIIPICTDKDRFTMIMANFSNYEKMEKPEPSQVNELIQFIHSSFKHSFQSEFPFFLILIYRLNKFRKSYACVPECTQFIVRWIEMFEKFTPNQVAVTLKLFLEKKDFYITFGPEETDTSVFILLADVCLNLMKTSEKIMTRCSHPRRVLFSKLLWISVSLKCRGEKGIVEKHDKTTWDCCLLKMSDKFTFEKETIKELKLGIKVSVLLNLTPELQFTTRHLARFLTNEKFVRPLCHVRDVINGIEYFVKRDEELLHIMATLKANYEKALHSSNILSFVKQASLCGTVVGALDEGISFLDSMNELWHKKKWNKGDQHEHFRAECLKLILLLQKTVCVTDPNASQLLKKLLVPEKGSMMNEKDFRKHIIQHILQEAINSFTELTIQMFYPLYRAHTIWPISFLHDYLKQYHIPNGIRISDVAWSEFFSAVLMRFKNDALQNHLLDFLIRVSEVYSEDKRTGDFIPDVLQIKVPHLFCLDTETGIDRENAVGNRFSNFLKGFIQMNNLRPALMCRIHKMVPNSDPTAFHWIILNVLQTEIIPELKSLQEDDLQSTKQLKDLLKVLINMLCEEISWFGPLSPQQKFCWGIIAAGCSKIPITIDSFEWVCNFRVIINLLGVIFNTYCKSRKLCGQKCLLAEAMPGEIEDCTYHDVRYYFKWVMRIQNFLHYWQNKLVRSEVNYDEILMYLNNREAIDALGRAVCATVYVMSVKEISEMKKKFTLCFERLNCQLLLYVPDQPEIKYCTLPKLLLHYGVGLPSEFQATLQQKIIFPENEETVCEKQQIILPSAYTDFNPGQDISLIITKLLSLYNLYRILEDLQTFLEPITHNMKMLVFFHLHKSKLFEKLLHKSLEDITTASSTQKPGRTFTNLLSPFQAFAKQSSGQAKDEGLPIKVLQRALDWVRDLLLKVAEGTATYSDVVVDNTLELETLNTEKEFAILTKFLDSLEMSHNSSESLEGVKCMLELFQFTSHINQIKQVCEQYGLKQCLKDEKLGKIVSIVGELKPEKSRASLTLIEAKEKITFIKEVLCLEQCTNYSSLDLFLAVANSPAFYQFIKDNEFNGSKGRSLFHEQYELITAHLQHEEYDENVLNHLKPAYEFIAPFMETDISFSNLMNRVTKLDTAHGLKQLKTVNENIMLITLWFSRTEGDTVENVAKELQNIFSAGKYQFQLNGDSYMYQTWSSKSTMTMITEASLKTSCRGTNSTDEKEEVPSSNTVGNVERKWTSEQIADFARKLGFLDTEKEGGDKIQQFLRLNSAVNKLFKLCVKLFKLGHPHYQKDTDLPVVSCNTPIAEADAMIDRTQQTLIEWQNQLAALYQEYPWLLFFSVTKALHLYSLLEKCWKNPELGFDSIVLEVSFLFENSKIVRKQLRNVVKSAIEETQKKVNGTIPMKFLGEFLNFVCGSKELRTCLCKERKASGSNSKLPSSTSPTTLGIPIGTYQLHYSPGYSQSQLICLITKLYNGVPECYEVFHCRPSTTQEELHLFSERIKHHPLTYLVLQVNKLPFSLQESLIILLEAPVSSQNKSSVHFIETSPSVLQEVPWINKYKNRGLDLSLDEAGDQCRQVILHPNDFTDIQLVYGHAGDGKTHYIRQQLAKSPTGLTVAINEAFTPLYAINCLNTLPHNVTGCAVFFNFTLMPYQEVQDETEKRKANELMETIGWFFYHFMVLGYVEDPTTGASFRFPGGQEWAIYIEVPSLDRSHGPEESLQLFTKKFPTLHFLGSKHLINPLTPIMVDADVQLVCKYLKAYKIGGVEGIDRLYINHKAMPKSLIKLSWKPQSTNKKVKFSEDPDLSDEECNQLLMEYMSDHIQETKIAQKLFIRYMKRRCAFLDNLPAFNLNYGFGEILMDEASGQILTDTRQLGSTLMKTMLEEVVNFCDPDMKNWAEKPHQQLIYDFHDGGGSFGLLSLKLESIPKNLLNEYRKIGIQLHTASELRRREILDQMLARALGLPSEAGKRLSIIDDCNYVLTPDYAAKMLNIHERYSCGMPVVIKGETGVGKTALVEMLSQLWNNALLYQWYKEKKAVIEAIQSLIRTNVKGSPEDFQNYLKIVEAIREGKEVSVHDLTIFCQLKDIDPFKGHFHELRKLLVGIEKNPAVSLLEVPSAEKEQQESSVAAVFELARNDDSAEAIATLLQTVLKAKVQNTFHKLNVHAALTPGDIKSFFEPVFRHANLLLKNAYLNADESKKTKMKMPFITVFLDEVNTSSCLGLFKEIVVDKTLDGKAIPENVFIVAACNPHRGNSMATHATETWLGSSYYVRPLHPTLEYLMWDYGSLEQYQERDYILAKMQMLHNNVSNVEAINLTDPIVESQSLMKRYAMRQLISQKMKPEEAEISSKSCVSQRDIQRVFIFYQWLMSVFNKLGRHGSDRKRRAVMVSLGIVYYMRLNSEYRKKYEEELNRIVKKERLPGSVLFSKAFNDELDYFCGKIKLPLGIAKTQALKENLFAIIVCTVTHTPLVIVGAPGSSKTLSFNLAIANLKGPESKMDLFRDIEIFKSLDPHFYQCSRRTTSNEIQTVFSRAINRQRSYEKFSLPIYCVVFMDEAGLPEESHESLKVLHYYLDKQEVSFVAITNHVLDAAKTNRAVSLFRPEVSNQDLETLAKGCLTDDPENPPAHLKQDLKTVVQFCPAYSRLMEDPKLKHFFGLRDFIHFINYLRRRRSGGITSQLVTKAIERNFNGVYWSDKRKIFQTICEYFLETMPEIPKEVIQWRSAVEVLEESLDDHPEGNRGENEVRYKLVIDATEDNSLIHLLISFGVLNREKTRIYGCSDFSGDSQLHKINTVAAILHSAIEGHTVVMNQTDDIHESFYDLFNQRFRKIDDPKHGPCYYSNIAIGPHLKPCRVHPDFSCIVVIKQTEVDTIPAPFLNRFEKYCISHETLLNTGLNHLRPCVRIILQKAKEKVKEFINVIGGDNSSFYGLKPQTLDSLLLSLLPPYGHTYKETPPAKKPISDDVKICLLHELLWALRMSAGFAIPACSIDELVADANHLFPLLGNDAMFKGAIDLLTTESVSKAVNEAMDVLHTAADPNSNEMGVVTSEMSQEACLVVSILQQWLIHHICKTLMQLMTPEGLCLHREQIPVSLMDNYLTNQHHFSLKKLTERHLMALESRQNTFSCPNKLLCFTRSSSTIFHLPIAYPHSACNGSVPDEAYLMELVHDDPAHVQICRVLSIQSQIAIQETLRDFVQKSPQKILLLMVNMQEATIEMVNHLRIMVEEAESWALLHLWDKEKKVVIEVIQSLTRVKIEEPLENYQTCLEIVEAISAGKEVSVHDLTILCQLKDIDPFKGRFHDLRKLLVGMEKNPAVSLLEVPSAEKEQQESSVAAVFELARNDDSAEAIATLLQTVLKAKVQNTFHKLNVHAALILRKLFVLLLHFPPPMFTVPCYPSLFRRGWSHYYLDSIGYDPTLRCRMLNVEDWFQTCCFSEKEFNGDKLLKACDHILMEAIPALVSRVTYGTRSTGPFTRDMTAVERSEKLKELLFDMGVGQKLCQMFRACWRPNVMTECLEQAARFTQSRESSLNISDALQSKFQSLFTDFIITMVTRMNVECNLDILFSKDCCPEVRMLFLSVLETVDPPRLNQLVENPPSQPKVQEYQQRFPFFSMVCKRMEQLIEDSRKEKEDKLLDEDPEGDTPSHSGGMGSERSDLAELVLKTIDVHFQKGKETPPDPLLIALKYIKDYPDQLWDRYISDFVYHSFHLDIVTSPSSKLFSGLFSELLELPPFQRPVYLHIYVHHQRVNLAKVCSLLRPLEKIWEVADGSPQVVRETETEHPFGDPQKMSSFVISALFSVLMKAQDTEDEGKKNDLLKTWYQTYQCLLSVPSLKSCLYMAPLPDVEEAKFNIMYSTFTLMHIYPLLDKDVLIKGDNLFNKMLLIYFSGSLQLNDPGVLPSLSDCIELAKEMIFDGTGTNDSTAQTLAQSLQEELFNHFLSPYRASYSSQDRDWFLRHANCQYLWKASTQLLDESVISCGDSEDILCALEKSENQLKQTVPPKKKEHCVTMAIYKRYLSLLLGSRSLTEDQETSDSDPLRMYDVEVRQNVANVLSELESEEEEEPGPYIPIFYQDCHFIQPSGVMDVSPHSPSHLLFSHPLKYNPLMQQPLCHLYFATLMEHLMAEPRTVKSLVELTETISQLLELQSVSRGDKIVLQIEKQAVIQCLLRELAHMYASIFINDNKDEEELSRIMVDLNDLLNDDSTGGGATGGHVLTLGMHLLHRLQSHRQFVELFTTKGSIIRAIQCTSAFHEQLETQTEDKPCVFPFIMSLENLGSTLGELYQLVKSTMLNIHGNEESRVINICALVAVADEWTHWKKQPKDKLNRRQAFKMILWLVTYHEFFAKKVSSDVLIAVVEQELKCYINDDGGVLQLIKSFLDPKNLFIESKESPTPTCTRGDAQILPDGYRERVDHEGDNNADPIYDLFNPSSPKDQSDHDLCHCLANLVGVVLGCQPRSNHLWYHLFSPDELKNTYMTGFMYDDKINPRGLLYNCGVTLTPDGQYGRLDYLPHATRGTYSLHSLYFLLWANFGAFCISMLTQPNSQSNIHGVLISDRRAIRHYCVSQVKSLWMNLRNNLSLSDEERSFLVTRCLMNMYETNMESAGISLGKLRTKEERDAYEIFWHERIFVPAWKELHDKFKSHSVLCQNIIFTNIRKLEACYPQYPSERDFLNYIQGLRVGWGLLRRFTVEIQRLELGGRLLPILVQFYQELHTSLAHLVTPERAYKLKIGQVIELTSKRVSPSLRDLYHNVKELYNKYVELVGGGQGPTATIGQGNRISKIEDDLPLKHFLSDSKEEEKGNDWLYTVIRDIAEVQNQFLRALYAKKDDDVKKGEYPHIKSQDPSYIYLADASGENCIVGKQNIHRGLTEFLQLVRTRLDPPIAYRAVESATDHQAKAVPYLLPHPLLSFNLTHLQEDVVSRYLSGKPIIQDISSMRTVFKFKQEARSSGLDSDPMGAASDITILRDALPQEYWVPLTTHQSRLLEYEFHSANYHILTDIVIGLRTSVELLIKEVPTENSCSSSVQSLSLLEFIQSRFGAEKSEYQVLNWIGIRNISNARLRCLSSTKLPDLFSTLEFFVVWIKEGLYDFCSLPFVLKFQLSEDDLSTTIVEQVLTKYPGTPSSLLKELRRLVKVMIQAEPHLVKNINKIADKPLISVLDTLGLTSELAQLTVLIPDTVLVHHYVKLRIVLRRLISVTGQNIPKEEKSLQDTNSQRQWSETVDDLWSTALPHLREKGFVILDSSLPANSSRQYSFHGDSLKEEETKGDLDRDLNQVTCQEFSEDEPIQPLSPTDSADEEPSNYPSSIDPNPQVTLINCSDTVSIDTLRQGLEDPEIHQGMPKMISKEKDIEQQANQWHSQMIAEFLKELDMKNHAKAFLEEEIDGLQLLNAGRDVYEALGVTSSVEYAQIAVLFRRKLMGVHTIHCSVSKLIHHNKKLASHEKTLEEAGVDGDMLKFAQQNDFLVELLKDIGIARPLETNRFCAVLKQISLESVVS